MSEAPDEPDALVYLDVEDALEDFAAIIGGTPEPAADQLRSRDALAGSLGRPANPARYEGADLAAQAAVLAHGVAETRVFIDGNKLDGARRDAEPAFLEINGRRVDATHRELADWIFSAGVTPSEVAELLRLRLVAAA